MNRIIQSITDCFLRGDDIGETLIETHEGAVKAWDARGRGRHGQDVSARTSKVQASMIDKAAKERPKPIECDTVEEAIKLIGEGKVVELPDAQHVHTLLNKLAVMANEAKAAGQKAKNYDLCKVTIKGGSLFCGESLGLPRINMPQFKGSPKPGSLASKLKEVNGEVDGTKNFMMHLHTIGIPTSEESVLASHLRASQRELVGTKVAGIMSSGKPVGKIVISRDNYVVDGHHNWAALVGRDAADGHLGDLKINTVKIDAPISEILHIANKWTTKFGILAKAAEQKKTGDFIS